MPTPTWLPFSAKFARVLVLQALLLASSWSAASRSSCSRLHALRARVEYLFDLFVHAVLVGYWLDRGPGPRRAHGRQQQVSRPLHHGRHTVPGRIASAGFGFEDQPLQVSAAARRRLLRHERLRPLPAARCSAFRVYWARLRGAAAGASRTCSGRAAASTAGATALRARRARDCALPALADRRGRGARLHRAVGGWIYYNTHVLNPFASRARARSATRPTTRSATRRSRARRSRASRRSTLQVDLFPAEQRVRLARHADARQQDRPADPRRLRALPETGDRATDALRRCRRSLVDEDAGARLASLRARRRARPGGDDGVSLRHRVRGARLRQQRRRSSRARQRQLPERRPDARDDADPELRLQRATPSSRPTATEEVRPGAQGAHARPRRPGSEACRTRSRATPTSSTTDATFCTARRPVAGRPRATCERDGPRTAGATSPTRWTRRWLDFYSFLSARYADQARRLARPDGRRRRSRSTTSPATSTTSSAWTQRREGLARLLHEELRAVPAQASCASSSSRATARRRSPQSFPNTMPFTRRSASSPRSTTDDPKDIDYPYYVTAHEVAHQWWAHQEIGGQRRRATSSSPRAWPSTRR